MKKNNVKKTIALVVAFILVVGCAVGGTLAWLQDKTDSVENTFTTAEVDIELTETTGSEYKMIPGATLEKDPTVTVVGGSEDAYVFIKIDKTTDLDKYLSYELADGWTKLYDDDDSIYYKEYTASETDVEYPVLKDNNVLVSGDVTNADMEAAQTNAPKLTFTAYAVQKANVDDASAAWDIATTLD